MMTKKEAKAFIEAMINLRNSATNEQAKNVSILYPKWEKNKNYEQGDRITYNNNLYIVNETHISNSLNLPTSDSTLYNLITE